MHAFGNVIDLWKNNLNCNPWNDDEKECQQLIEPERCIDELANERLGYPEESTVHFQYQWPERYDRDKRQGHDTQIDEHAPKKDIFKCI